MSLGKRLLVIGLTVATLATTLSLYANAPPARADGQLAHNPASGTLAAPCAGCHRVHTAQAPSLLMQSDLNLLCQTCHGSSGTGSDLNVDLGRSNASATAALRGGGFQQALINTADDTFGVIGAGGAGPFTVTSKHDVGAGGTIWGNGAVGSGVGTALTSFNCVNCHDPHGGANAGAPTYRLLRPQPTGSGAATGGVVIDETAGSPRNYSTTNFYEPLQGLTGAGAGTGVSAWCSQCHTRYLKNTSPGTSSGDPIFTFQHRASDTQFSGLLVCTKCHTSHGTNATASAALGTAPYPGETTDGQTSRLLKMNDRAICRKCHSGK